MAQSKMLNPKDSQQSLKKDITDDMIEQLKSTTTVFFYKKDQIGQLDSLKEAATAGWNLTHLIFDDISNFDKYASDPKYSYFAIEGYTTTYQSAVGPGANASGFTHYFLGLRDFKDIDNKGKITTNGFCRIELYPNLATIATGEYGGNNSNKIVNKLYEKGVFYNWTPILLKAQLENVATNIKNNIRPWLFQDIKNEDLTEILSKDTLYVPQRLLMDFNAWNGKEKIKDVNVFTKYKYNYRICTDQELYDIFQTQKRGKLLFEYVKSCTDKFITVYDLKAACIIYKKYTPASYNLKSSDIEALNGKE